MVLIEQFRAALPQTIVAINDPEKLAVLGRAARWNEYLILGLFLAITMVVAAIRSIGLKKIRFALRTEYPKASSALLT